MPACFLIDVEGIAVLSLLCKQPYWWLYTASPVTLPQRSSQTHEARQALKPKQSTATIKVVFVYRVGTRLMTKI